MANSRICYIFCYHFSPIGKDKFAERVQELLINDNDTFNPNFFTSTSTFISAPAMVFIKKLILQILKIYTAFIKVLEQDKILL